MEELWHRHRQGQHAVTPKAVEQAWLTAQRSLSLGARAGASGESLDPAQRGEKMGETTRLSLVSTSPSAGNSAIQGDVLFAFIIGKTIDGDSSGATVSPSVFPP